MWNSASFGHAVAVVAQGDSAARWPVDEVGDVAGMSLDVAREKVTVAVLSAVMYSRPTDVAIGLASFSIKLATLLLTTLPIITRLSTWSSPAFSPT